MSKCTAVLDSQRVTSLSVRKKTALKGKPKTRIRKRN